MSLKQTDDLDINRIYNMRKSFRAERKIKERFIRLFVFALIVLMLCCITVGLLYIVRNSPDHGFVVLRDRYAPVVDVHDAVSANGKTYEIHDFVDNINDISAVELSYVKAPDYSVDGNQEIIIRFTDEAGNFVDKSLNLEVYHDSSAPVIYGEDDVYTYWNEPISYKNLIYVEDDYDEECEVDIDNSRVDITVIGDYEVIYTARDSVGNAATKVITIHVLEPDTDEYYLMKANELCDKIISQIITPDMDKLHQVWEVYEYVGSIPYVPTDYIRNYIREGYKMLRDLRGDCYGSYSAVRLLLDRLGIDNIPVITDEQWTTHFWNMVSIDNGATWYHLDATNWSEWLVKPNMCMISDARLNEISAQHRGTHIHVESDYPATPFYSMPVPPDITAKYGVTDYD